MKARDVGSAVPSIRRAAATRRAIALVVITLTGIAGLQLFILGDSTASYFAWTVNPPLAAAFLGAAFWAVSAAAFAAYRGNDWGQLSLLLPVGTIVTSLVLLTTVLHLDKFHLTSPDPAPLVAAWVWLAVYVVVPPIFALMWVSSARGAGAAAMAATPVVLGASGVVVRRLPQALRTALAVVGIAVAIVGVVLFLSPGTLAWPWPLTPLTSRMTGAFLVGVGTAMLGMALENDLDRLAFAAIAIVGFSILEGLAIVRFSANFDFGAVAGLAWLGLLVVVGLLGVAVLVLERAGSPRSPVIGSSAP